MQETDEDITSAESGFYPQRMSEDGSTHDFLRQTACRRIITRHRSWPSYPRGGDMRWRIACGKALPEFLVNFLCVRTCRLHRFSAIPMGLCHSLRTSFEQPEKVRTLANSLRSGIIVVHRVCSFWANEPITKSTSSKLHSPQKATMQLSTAISPAPPQRAWQSCLRPADAWRTGRQDAPRSVG